MFRLGTALASRKPGCHRYRGFERHWSELAVQLGSTGYRVGLIARRLAEIQAAAAGIVAAGGTAGAAVADVSDRSALRAAIDSIVDQLGPVEVMVANAGFGPPRGSTRSNGGRRGNDAGECHGGHLFDRGCASGHARAAPGISWPSRAWLHSKDAGRVGLLRQQVGRERLHGGFKNRPAQQGGHGHTVCPGFVQTAMTPMESATPFIMPAQEAARRIASLIARRKGGVVCFHCR